MSDASINYFVSSGTNAERLAHTPSLATPAGGPDPSVVWFETDTGDLYAWDFAGASWELISSGGGGGGTGDVVGPAGATNNHVALFDGATGKLIKDGGALPGALGPAVPFHRLSLATNNATAIKGSAGTLFGVHISHEVPSAAYSVYVKFYDKATAPNPAADTPVAAYRVNPGAVRDIPLPVGLAFTLGIGMAMVQGQADNNNTAIAAGDAILDVDYS